MLSTLTEYLFKSAMIVALLGGLALLTNIVFSIPEISAGVEFLVPAIWALKTVPVVDTLMSILIAAGAFELLFWTLKLAFNFLRWLNLTGDHFLP